MKRLSKAATFCLTANAVGLGCYWFFCSRLWIDMPNGELYADDGPSAISWVLTAFPFMAFCAVLNVGVFIWAVRKILVGKGRSLMSTWAVAIGAWVLLRLYVRSHIVG